MENAERQKRKTENDMFDITRFAKENDATLSLIYGEKKAEMTKRIEKAVRRFCEIYGEGDVSVFSVPGRSEICGNHTDHNRGEVFAASIDLDIVAVARVTDGKTIRVTSEGFSECEVGISDLSPKKSDEGTSASLIRGVCDGFLKRNFKIAPFDCYMTSNVLGGSGLSSSAAFEIMISNIQNHFANGGKADATTMSQISQYAENVHFGKPCGLMDQMACATGGFVHIDFADPSSPVCDNIPFDIGVAGYALCIVSTGGSHADLTDDYAAVPAEMKAVAAFFGKDALRAVSRGDVMKNIPALREKVGDRAVLRALHFFDENDRVREMQKALEAQDVDAFLNIIYASGESSAIMLQNYFAPKAPAEQGITLAYAVAKELLGGRGAVRVHGGGFAGTIQAFVPKDALDAFVSGMESAFGRGSVSTLFVRPFGAIMFK